MFFIMFGVIVAWVHMTIKTQEIEHFKYVHFIAHKFYLKEKLYRRNTHKKWIKKINKVRDFPGGRVA